MANQADQNQAKDETQSRPSHMNQGNKAFRPGKEAPQPQKPPSNSQSNETDESSAAT